MTKEMFFCERQCPKGEQKPVHLPAVDIAEAVVAAEAVRTVAAVADPTVVAEEDAKLCPEIKIKHKKAHKKSTHMTVWVLLFYLNYAI